MVSTKKRAAVSQKSRVDDDQHLDGIDSSLEISRTAIGSKRNKVKSADAVAIAENASAKEENDRKPSNSGKVSCAVETPVTSTKGNPGSCRNYVQNGSCQFGSKCRFAHDLSDIRIENMQPEDFDRNLATVAQHQRKRKKTRSKQKNIRKDNRPEEAKPVFTDDGNYIGRPLTAVSILNYFLLFFLRFIKHPVPLDVGDETCSRAESRRR